MTDPGDKPPRQDPPMEEILASIRRIIAEENAEQKPTTSGREGHAGRGIDKRFEVLELTEMVGEDGRVTSLKAAEAAPPTTPPASPAAGPPDRSAAGDALVSLPAAASATGAFKSLFTIAQEREKDQGEEPMTTSTPLGNGGRTLEDLVREELRALMKTWLDQNLPQVVERIVEREVKRITRNLDDA